MIAIPAASAALTTGDGSSMTSNLSGGTPSFFRREQIYLRVGLTVPDVHTRRVYDSNRRHALVSEQNHLRSCK